MAMEYVRPCIKEKMEMLRRKRANLNIILVMFLVTNIVTVVKCSENKTEINSEEISERLKVLNEFSGRSLSDIYQNGTFRTGNKLWDNILNKCSLDPSMSCLQNNVYSYLDKSLDYGDVSFGGVCFKKNNVDLNKYTKEANYIYLSGSKKDGSEKSYLEDNKIEDDDEDESESPLEEVTDTLYDKGVKFLLTHDMQMTLPDIMFHGSTLKISPRALTQTGALVHIDLEPKEQNNGEGRFLFKKIKKYLKKKLVLAVLGIILVVKLIVLKLIFVLPVITGVTTAKKLLLKVLLFVFPALSHIFKLCSWYHQNYHTTKYHHHHHLITHHHKVPHHPQPVYGPPSHSHGHGHGSFSVIKPPTESPPSFEHYPQDWELSGPGLGSEYLASDIHRNAIANFKPNIEDVNDIKAWGLGLPPGPSMNTGEYFSSSNNVVNSIQGNSGRPVGPPNPYKNKKSTIIDPLQAEKEALIRAAALAARVPPSPVRDEILRVSALKLTETNRVKAETELVKQQQQILAAQDPETIAAEKFYGPLVDRINAILNTLGAPDSECRERAVCSLYKDPFKHAPYSNLVSNELSKDSNELPSAADSKTAVMYYKYVQAAREGQEEKDCIVSYPNCIIDFSKK